jgi:hypothetical protein
VNFNPLSTILRFVQIWLRAIMQKQRIFGNALKVTQFMQALAKYLEEPLRFLV